MVWVQMVFNRMTVKGMPTVQTRLMLGMLIFDHLEILDGSDPGYDQMGEKRYDPYRGMRNGGSG